MVADPAAFPTLDDADMAALEAAGTRRAVAVGEYLFHAGDPSYDLFVVESGAVEIVADTDQGERDVVRHGPRNFAGELNLLTGARVLVSARVVEAGEVLIVPREEARRLIADYPKLSDTLLSAFLARRALLQTGVPYTLRVVGSRYSADAVAIREFLTRTQIPHQYLDPDGDTTVESLLREFNVRPADLPVVITPRGVIRNATAGSLAEYLGITVANLPKRCFDLVVVGGGPAGLAASVYGASEGLGTLGVERIAPGGQAGASSRIENYLGFPTGISGGDLTQRAFVQAEKFGAQLTAPCTVASLRDENGYLMLTLSDGADVAGRAVIAATGARYRRLDVAGLDRFEGTSVFYAATTAEVRLCGPSPVIVVGGGNSAGQAVLFLAESGCATRIVIRGDNLGKSMSRYLVERIMGDPSIEVMTNAEVTGLYGDVALRSVRVRHPDGETEIPCAALFSFIGAEPSSEWLSGCVALDDHGFVLTDLELGRKHLGEQWDALQRTPLPFETSHPGLFAVGDVRSGSMKRVASAVGEGSAAVRSVHQYLAFRATATSS
ncbi:MAG: FAD-dependent oxidoreductase [Candidatus Dormibacteraeota bacterium]|nr:FAD-dependent oxidoreductase [Candidatus Dormibacteraeota bacterium]